MIHSLQLLKNFFHYLIITSLLLKVNGEGELSATETDKKSWIEKIDTNGDRKLSLNEFSNTPKLKNAPKDRLDKMFLHLDKNGDHFLSADELPHRLSTKHSPQKAIRGHMQSVDLDKDGKVSLEEFMSTPPPHLSEATPTRIKRLFRHMDTDKDGFLSPKDKKRPFLDRRFGSKKQSSTNEPKKRLKNEVIHLEALIKKLDLNQDENLSYGEYIKGEKMRNSSEKKQRKSFNLRDKNQDGVISPLDKENL